MGANEDIFKHLDVECYNCDASGQVQTQRQYGPPLTTDCDICYGTGYQVTGAGCIDYCERSIFRVVRMD